MNTYELAALGTGPSFLFVSNELSYAELLDVYEIVNHTHTILGSIAPIQVIKPVARKTVTVGTVADFSPHHLFAVLDSACDAGFRFETVVPPATGACLLVSRVCTTEAAVHPTGSDQGCVNSILLFRTNFGHIWISAKVCLVASV